MKTPGEGSGIGRLLRHAARLRAAVAIAIALTLSAAACAAEPTSDSTRLEDIGVDEFNAIGEQATGAVCTYCHGWEAIFGGPRQLPGQWDFIISDMVGRGAKGTEEQLNLVARYLKWSWGMVLINSASAEDLVTVLGLSAKDAEKVIAYRDKHGSFADLESLKAVPSIDVATIEAQADAIMFN